MPRGLLFGRRIRVTVGGLIVTDKDPAESFEINEARTLDCVFSTEAHLKLEPTITEATVWGLNERVRTAITNAQDTARAIAWEAYQQVAQNVVQVEDEQVSQFQQQISFKGIDIVIEAGYQDDFAVIARAQTLPEEGAVHEYDGSGWVTHFRAQDNRYPWQNSFVSEQVAPGVTIVELQAALQLAEQFEVGEVEESVVRSSVPDLLETKDFGGYANGRVIHGDTRDFETEISDRLGYERFLDRGQVRLIRADETTFEEAVVLQLIPKEVQENEDAELVPGGLLNFKILGRGFVEAKCLLNHRVTTGRQVLLQMPDGSPIGVGSFRVDYVHHHGGNDVEEYYSEMTLRPVTVEQAKSV